jgi:hypothetical protein
MPKATYISDVSASTRVPVATEAELLEFANAVRTAGGANVIEALLPSVQRVPNACLIANALNFRCEVTYFGWGSIAEAPHEFEDQYYRNVSPRWQMSFPENMDEARIHAIAKAVPGCRARRLRPSGRLVMSLPEHIGNAAAAFDSGEAFQVFVDNG